MSRPNSGLLCKQNLNDLAARSSLYFHTISYHYNHHYISQMQRPFQIGRTSQWVGINASAQVHSNGLHNGSTLANVVFIQVQVGEVQRDHVRVLRRVVRRAVHEVLDGAELREPLVQLDGPHPNPQPRLMAACNGCGSKPLTASDKCFDLLPCAGVRAFAPGVTDLNGNSQFRHVGGQLGGQPAHKFNMPNGQFRKLWHW